MIRKQIFSAAIAAIVFQTATSQEALKYQLPPDEIIKIVDAPVTPLVSVSPARTEMLVIERLPIITIKELSAPELRLAGLRINPATSGPSRQTFNKSFTLMNIDGTNARPVAGLPADASLGYPDWSPDGKKFSFSVTKNNGIELWICDVASAKAAKISDNLNMVFGSSVSWLSDSRRLVFTINLPGRGAVPERSPIPEGPVIQENLGKQGQAATYQDLLKDPVDEAIFEYFALSQLMMWDGSNTIKVGEPGMITSATPSPDGRYLLVDIIRRPFSYTVPFYDFPSVTVIMDIKGNPVKTLLDRALVENEPRGYDQVLPGRRDFSWRDDKPATINWIEALDGGDYKNEMEFHDQVWSLDAPFSGEPVKYIATALRCSRIFWGNDTYALIQELSQKTRMVVISSFSPQDPQNTKKKIQEFNRDDGYHNPGRFVTDNNSFGMKTLLFTDKGKSLYLTGDGSSPEGDRPFIDKYDIASGKTTRLWRSEAPYYESFSAFIDVTKGLILTTRQSVTDPPDYFIRNLKNRKLTQVTRFENPYPQLTGVRKELVKYKRRDSLDLSFTLYLPAGYDKEKNGPLPTLLWAYPREFNDLSAAGQVSGSPYTFTRISPSSALVYVTQGYAILMDAAFPIVGVGGKEPNDTFVEQLTADAEAAVSKAVEMGVTDPARVAVSGHSYGAFMTANLLAHTRLFAAGIAESGAYNRSLTPFGFQNERRSYWEAPEIYNRMSPFMNADKVKDPIMLIHGMADNNSGTFPIQSERFYAALKGFGAVVRLVLLPDESHGYAARESILHKHWEVLGWMDKYVKNKKTP
ncbi:MAG: prolyl oligopeptidase family serine peptidase [Bacteroidota bacterium]|nr:prolyl oligopeptidase family serine peptidase [Bacteroidota bacterium]